ELLLKNDDIAYNVEGAAYKKGEFNPQAMDFRNLSLTGTDIFLQKGSAGGTLKGVAFRETSGLILRNSGLAFSIDEQAIDLNSLVLDLNNNRLLGELQLGYTSLQNFLNAPEEAQIQARFSQIYLEPRDLFLFQPSLRSNQYVRTFSESPLSGRLTAEGTLASFQIHSADFNWGNTSLSARGQIRNAMETEALFFNFPSVQFNSTKGDISRFVEMDSLGVQIPKDLALSGSFKGNLENITADVELNSSEGNILAQGFFNSEGQLAFDADVQVLDLDLGTLLQNEKLGELNLNIKAVGQGSDLNSLNASLEAVVERFSYNRYPITNLEITGDIEEGKGPVNTRYRVDNLN